MVTENIYCDRCKKLIKEDTRNNHGFHLYKRKFILCTVRTDEYMDLCQDCYDSLYDWVKNIKESEQCK